MRGVTSTTIFILVVTGLIVASGLLIFWRWMEFNKSSASELSCKLKQQSYCIALKNKENPNWDEIEPKSGCERFGIVKPTEEECKRLFE